MLNSVSPSPCVHALSSAKQFNFLFCFPMKLCAMASHQTIKCILPMPTLFAAYAQCTWLAIWIPNRRDRNRSVQSTKACMHVFKINCLQYEFQQQKSSHFFSCFCRFCHVCAVRTPLFVFIQIIWKFQVNRARVSKHLKVIKICIYIQSGTRVKDYANGWMNEWMSDKQWIAEIEI